MQVHKYLKAVEEAKRTMDVERTVELIREYGLVREQLRTEMLNEPAIWEAMLPSMPLTALTRNLGKMSLLGSVLVWFLWFVVVVVACLFLLQRKKVTRRRTAGIK